MKKMYLVLIAVVMAVGFSAFSPTRNTNMQVTYQDDLEFWHNYEGDLCPNGPKPECIVATDHGQRQLFYNENTALPVYDRE